MQRSRLGGSDLEVSRFSLGTMTFGNRGPAGIACVDRAGADQLVGTAIDAGINLFDTADVYNAGESETLLGEVLGARRKDVLIATKVGLRVSRSPEDQGLSARHIAASIDRSLARLGTDHVDLYLAHRIDPSVPLEETLAAFDAVVRSGKARHIGCSNWPAWLTAKAIMMQRANGWAPFVTGQVYYSLLDRDVEQEIVPCAVDHDVGLMIWSALAMGRLTGKYAPSAAPTEGRLAAFKTFLRHHENREGAVLAALRAIAEARGKTPAAIALAWTAARPTVSTVLLGVRTIDQLRDNLSAADLLLSDDEMARLDAASARPPLYPTSAIAEVLDADSFARFTTGRPASFGGG
ncbi:aldo/keto reductase [Rhizorhabdus dicambivorans]|uniref:Aldo/keto reductase n=1 Tax=Rhizorhabdus dicambivorans TaxID=1850238 RepID=A0A2A4FS69_9SPHN|nr:aldo/keto reductase [Rhizorhabdus dicambivorans]ATE67204.1 aldo/keto reductase [Rhizorhabdus dicambivorans]PCE40544.1 aldo/keto reductase [Rhizorhabdus dicambivorans]